MYYCASSFKAEKLRKQGATFEQKLSLITLINDQINRVLTRIFCHIFVSIYTPHKVLSDWTNILGLAHT